MMDITSPPPREVLKVGWDHLYLYTSPGRVASSRQLSFDRGTGEDARGWVCDRDASPTYQQKIIGFYRKSDPIRHSLIRVTKPIHDPISSHSSQLIIGAHG